MLLKSINMAAKKLNGSKMTRKIARQLVYDKLALALSDLKPETKNKKFENYSLIPGNILNTLPEFLNKYPQFRFSLVHIDVDVYEPTKKILELIIPKIVRGGIIVLDDYGSVEGETLAVEENELLKKLPIKKLPICHTPSYIQID